MDLIEHYCPQCGAACTAAETVCAACHTSLSTPAPVNQASDAAPESALHLATCLHTRQLFRERYRIVRQVGSGGFGAVYEAEDTQEARKVAIKEIGLGGLSAQQVIEATGSFNREVQMLSSLSHTSIPRMYEQLTDTEHWYLIMEFIPGKTVEEVQAEALWGRLPLDTVLQLGVQICYVLEYLHGQRPVVIFRDIKPANIMLTPAGKVYLIDFGVARQYQRTKLRDTVAFGSPGYAAPEQYGKAQTTPHADIYSLGALLHCLLTGDDPSEHPFQFSRLTSSGMHNLDQLDALLQRMVASDPLERPANGGEVRAALHDYLLTGYQQGRNSSSIWLPPQGQTPPAVFPTLSSSQPPAYTPPQKPPRATRRRVLTIGLITGGMVLVGGGAFVNSYVNALNRSYTVQVDSPVQTAIAQNAQATADARQHSGIVPTYGPAFWSPHMKRVAVINKDAQQMEIYTVQSPTSPHIIPLKDAFGAYGGAVIWSPDDNLVYYYNSGFSTNESFVWNVQQGQKHAFPQDVVPFAWSPDSRYMAATAEDFFSTEISFVLLRAADGKKLFSQKFNTSQVLISMAWSPDSRALVFPTTDNTDWLAGHPWKMEIWDRSSQQKVSTIGGTFPANESGPAYYVLSDLAWSPNGRTIAVGMTNNIFLVSMDGLTQTGISALNVRSNSSRLPHILAWSPDSRYLAVYQDYADAPHLTVYQVASGKAVPFVPDDSIAAGDITAFAWTMDANEIFVIDSMNNMHKWKLQQ